MHAFLRLIRKPARTIIGPALTRMLLCILLFVAGAAFGDTYKGVLVTPGSDLTIPIVVEFKNSGGLLSGKIKTSSPLTLEGPIVAGDMTGYTCNLKASLSPEVTIAMTGTCMTTFFEGKFILLFPRKGRRPGTFRLEMVMPAKEGEPGKSAAPIERKGPSVSTITACLNENTVCMVACPHGDSTAEFLCANSCTSKFEACKAKKRNY